MTFKQFMAFITVAKHLNITRAAEELHITQPSISKQLSLLQYGYRVKLYYKKAGGGIALTAEGHAFLTYANKIVRNLDALKTRFNHTTVRTATKPFTVGGTYALASELMPRLLSEFKKAHLSAGVVLRSGTSFDIHEKILRGDIEVGFVAKTPRSKDIEVQPYGTHPLVAFVHKNHPYARKGDLTPAELASGPLILRGGPRLKSGAEAVLRQRGYKPNVVLRCETLEAVRVAVRNKMGVGILSYDTVKNAIQRGEFKVLRVPGLVLEAKSFIVYHKERPLSANARDFLALLRKDKSEGKDLETTLRGGAIVHTARARPHNATPFAG